VLVAVHAAEISGDAGDKSRRKLKNGGNKIFSPKAASLRANPISHGIDAHWLLAGKAQNQVEKMDPSARHHGIGFVAGTPTSRDFMNSSVKIIPVHGVNLAQFPGPDHLLDFLIKGRSPKHQVGHQRLFFANPSLADFFQLRSGAAKGLFHEHVLPGTQGIPDLPGMLSIKRGNGNGMESGLHEHLAPISEGSGFQLPREA
jgi:hypothetical protein